MGSALQVIIQGSFSLAYANSFSVFSAPRYCDSTENKGAYINIGPDYKLQFHKFDAVPHPNIKPMVCSHFTPHLHSIQLIMMFRPMHKAASCR